MLGKIHYINYINIIAPRYYRLDNKLGYLYYLVIYYLDELN